MLGTSGLVAVAVLAVGLNVADIARGVWQQGPMPGARGRAISAQAWTPPVEDPADRERDRNNAYLQRKAAEREHGFQQQQRQQAEAAIEDGTISGEVAVEDGPAVDQAA